MIEIEDHPLLEACVLRSELPAPLSELGPSRAATRLALEAELPFARSEEVRAAVRRLLRHGGYKPTGRGKPASEYLVRAATEGQLASINPVVDALNAASLHSGLPISVVDLELAAAPYRIAIAPSDSRYVFNASGQEIRLDGLLCLFDAGGPSANAVKDAQRTKTHPGTRRTLSVVWGTNEHPGLARRVGEWYAAELEALGARSEFA